MKKRDVQMINTALREGKPVFDAERINSQIDALNHSYNSAIDDAIKVVQGYKEAGYNHHALGGIISQLTELKKSN